METVQARSIFSRASGFIRRGGFDWTCNPYVGCTFGCMYCYAMFLQQARAHAKEDWGKWLQAKANAVELARRQAPRLAGQAVYLSSVTDPYLPVERRLQLTRGILQALLPHQPRLLVQTRGPLVVRDLDLLAQLRAVRVNLSIPTDSESICQAFEPKAPPLEERWAALRAARAAAVPVGICVTPMLPLANPEAFVARLSEFRPDVLVVQDFHDANGGFGADTSAGTRRLLRDFSWTTEAYRRCVEHLRQRGDVYEGEAGFFPPPTAQAPPSHASSQP